MEATQLVEQHEQNGTKAHNGKVVSATNAERVQVLPDPPSTLWMAGIKRWKEQGQAMVDAGVLVTRDLPILEDHCTLYQQRVAWTQAIGEKVDGNGGKMPLGDAEIERAAMHLEKINNPFIQTCELLGIGALARTKRGNAAKRSGAAGGVQQAAPKLPTGRRIGKK